ncbi:MAG: hypothetical protein M1401_00415 [Chloroflexi bacterium]|nr:hypothetical protein [Chloroflexota bacterium]MCL5107343.1 hypothetical protein [Chloroflexota bacterium]
MAPALLERLGFSRDERGALVSQPAAAAPSAPQQVSSAVTECGTGLGCFIEASRTGHLAKVDYTMAVDFFGLFLSNTDSLAIEGKGGDRLRFSDRTIQAVASVTEAIIKAAQDQGLSDAEIQKALSTAEGVAGLVASANTYVDPEMGQELSKSKESQQARVGTGKQRSFPQPDLTAMLERWQNGQYSSSDWDSAECTDIVP